MHFTIRQTATGWELVNASGEVVLTRDRYDQALNELATILDAQLALGEGPAASSDEGLLPEAWVSQAGIAFQEQPDPMRDFTTVAWSWRDPEVSTLPLMLQTETEMGHFGAQLAGYMTELSEAGGTVAAQGRFYDSDVGRQLRDMLLGGRSFGVSVDPGAGTTTEFVCLAEDEDGWCTQPVDIFLTYEIVGLTATPFPAFARAAIGLDTAPAEGSAEDNSQAETATPAIAASAPVRPPLAWFTMAEPPLDDERYVDQGRDRVAIPLTITDEGEVYGHMAVAGDCHVGYASQCVSPPTSPSGYAHFQVGAVVTAEGRTVATGTLVMGTEHAALTLGAAAAQDHYAHTGHAWADVRVIDGDHGPWVAGALRPEVSDEQRRALQASALSGDWRMRGGQLELVACLAVNTPGFGVLRDQSLAAAAGVRQLVAAGTATAMVAAGLVRRCSDCARRAAAARRPSVDHDMAEVLSRLDAMAAQLGQVERRTRHLRVSEAQHLRQRIAASAQPAA